MILFLNIFCYISAEDVKLIMVIVTMTRSRGPHQQGKTRAKARLTALQNSP